MWGCSFGMVCQMEIINGNNKANVAWEDLCFPKDEGGLCIRGLKDSSHLFALSLIWRLFSLSGSLWVAWTRHYLMRNALFWEAKDNSMGS